MTDFKTDENLNDVLGQVAYQMKDTMDTMYAALQRVAPADARDEDGELDENAALLTRNFFRLRRLSGNLEEAGNLDSPLFPCSGFSLSLSPSRGFKQFQNCSPRL